VLVYVPQSRVESKEKEMAMNLGTYARRIGLMLSTGAASVVAVVLAASMASASALWCGAGRGPTAQVAIQSAIGDAQTSASAEGLFRCTLVGEPQVFEYFNDPNFGHVFRAQVNMACT
jgi:hypothetical protein